MTEFIVINVHPRLDIPVMTSINLEDNNIKAVIENFNGYRITFEKIKE